MKVGIRKGLCILTVAALIAGGIQIPVAAADSDISQIQNMEEVLAENSVLTEESGVTVSTSEDFMTALQQHQSPITIAADTTISIGKEADTDGRMLPVKIPADTMIRGTQNSSLNSRSPIQLEGDVCFQNMELTFDSTDALGSVPHREIFLAGHSLTFDNVSTWLEGGADLGSFGGTEKELLPTVYGGGYSNTEIGENASLTVRNSNANTMFQAIYMGHDAESDNKVPYRGKAVLNIDAYVTVRGRVDVSQNSRAQINIAGGEDDYVKAKEYYGNENTTLTLSRSSINGATVENVGNLVVADKGCLISKTASYGNVTLQRGGCLDLNEVNNVLISGDFAGVDHSQEECGILVVNKEGLLTIEGNVTGTTQLQTENRLFPGLFNAGWPYISAQEENASVGNFILSEKSIEFGYQMNCDRGIWSVSLTNQEELNEIGEIEIVSAPSEVTLSKIWKTEDDTIPDENIYFEIIWKDTEGNVISNKVVEEQKLYELDYIFKIKTEYWESDESDILEKTDWSNALTLITSEEHPGKYYLQAEEGAKPGEYTFLFCSKYCVDPLNTVKDVKGLKDLVKAEYTVTFLDEGPEQTPAPTCSPVPTYSPIPTQTPVPPIEETSTPSPTPPVEETLTPSPSATPVLPEEDKPTLTPVPALTSAPAHTHKYQTAIIKATVENDGERIDKCDCGKIDRQEIIYRPQKVVLSSDTLVYTGKERKPSVKITDANGKIISPENYMLLYQNNKNVGKASVTIVFSRDYSGRITKFFDIIPKKIKAFRLIPKSKGFLVKWKKQSTQATGYEIQYSASRKFPKKSTKIITVKNNKTVSKMISRGKAGKRQYVRIRAYKAVKIDGKTMKFYSGWSRIISGKETK